MIQDAVVAGQDRDDVGLLVFQTIAGLNRSQADVELDKIVSSAQFCDLFESVFAFIIPIIR